MIGYLLLLTTVYVVCRILVLGFGGNGGNGPLTSMIMMVVTMTSSHEGQGEDYGSTNYGYGYSSVLGGGHGNTALMENSQEYEYEVVEATTGFNPHAGVPSIPAWSSGFGSTTASDPFFILLLAFVFPVFYDETGIVSVHDDSSHE
ncbi:hypothetical protein BGW38_002753 [Lunasporangiospora selenospora]|uniref:Uncharacterized protein n=1 Tax=Lunasporangiospora selenospora TaxID=979761 RepID=A0A9P6FSS5_9FUNG|nr:hypothetical protein BGW38_002753 [Lunasporangiospora selenospora]